MAKKNRILLLIVLSQFFCTSLWFAGNGVMDDLLKDFLLNDSALGHLTSAVQFGFISGTLIFAILTLADRFSPSKIFFICAVLGAATNLGMIWNGNVLPSILGIRFFTGFFLAGIYPVGMKIAADYFKEGLGKSLSFLVGALVLGTALPHLLKASTMEFNWRIVIILTSMLAFIGGTLILFLAPDGPYRKKSLQFDFTSLFKVFQNKKFRSAAFGYFGHMWELYAFWAFVPVILANFNQIHAKAYLNIPLWSFMIIGLGSLSCMLGGYISQIYGVKRIAFISLSLSCLCCLLSPLIFFINSTILLLLFLSFWGMVVIADSPLFSTLVANNTIPELKATALTIVNCIGFSITIVSIQIINIAREMMSIQFLFMMLAIGPIFGLLALSERSRNLTN